MKHFQNKGFSLRAETGFSLPELMVVIVIIGILAGLALPRLRAFIARGRQAEAKNLLAQIHTLQTTHQNFSDKFAEWAAGSGTQIGKGGTCTIADSSVGTCEGTGCSTNTTRSTCVGATGCSWKVTTPGAWDLGFKPQDCGNLRYGFWIIKGTGAGVNLGKEGYLAVAYAPSDESHRIYPTCTGAYNNSTASNRAVTMKHPFGTSQIADQSGSDGDWQTVTEDKVWGHDDIVIACN